MFYAAAREYGGQAARASLAAFLADRVIPVLHAPAPEPSRRGVLAAAAQLTLLLGNMSVDSGHARTAQHYHYLAARLASDADDRSTLAIALRTMATHAYELGHHTPTVLRLSEQAVAHASAAPPAVQAYTETQYAVLLAHYDRRAALDALTRAERYHSRSDGPPGPFTAYPSGGLYYQRAETLSILGDHHGCVNALNTSLRLRPEAERHAVALTRARLAETHMRIGHLEQALTQWQAFLEAYATISSARAARHMQNLRGQLQPYQRNNAVRHLLDQTRLLS
ncbi:tol-pal system YbgF family protein [Streptomyces sp. NPDC059680]|uniref:tetratricopeptide repeat protein n=1 Tax=Streptomyces sp. NPDC059680 TaxID=3346904 RepID=UPI0036BE612C